MRRPHPLPALHYVIPVRLDDGRQASSAADASPAHADVPTRRELKVIGLQWRRRMARSRSHGRRLVEEVRVQVRKVHVTSRDREERLVGRRCRGRGTKGHC